MLFLEVEESVMLMLRWMLDIMMLLLKVRHFCCWLLYHRGAAVVDGRDAVIDVGCCSAWMLLLIVLLCVCVCVPQ